MEVGKWVLNALAIYQNIDIEKKIKEAGKPPVH